VTCIRDTIAGVVATVSKSGTITAVGAGYAQVVAWYGPRDGGIKVSIPVAVR
jgi:hypothetical protein